MAKFYPPRLPGKARKPGRQRGAALMFALAAVLITMTVIAGMFIFVGSHVNLAETQRNASRVIHIAEAGANWQLNQMSRCLPPGHPGGIPGYMTYDQFQAANSDRFNGAGSPVQFADYNNIANEDSADPNNPAHFQGAFRTFTVTLDGQNAWQPPNAFKVISIGEDPITHVQRAVSFNGLPVNLYTRYVLFATNLLTLNSTPSPGSGINISGMMGINRSVAMPGGVPNYSSAPGRRTASQFIMGTDADRQPPAGQGSWPANWDVARLSDNVAWPTVEQVTRYIYANKAPAELAPDRQSGVNPLDQIWVYTADPTDPLHQRNIWKPLSQFSEFTGRPPDRLTDNAADPYSVFAKSAPVGTYSSYHIVCLSVKDASGNGMGNLFYFKGIQMGRNDILILDTGPEPNQAVADSPLGVNTLRILLDGDLGQPNTVTNLGYCNLINRQGRQNNPSIIWLNNSTKALNFTPTIAQRNFTPISMDNGNYTFYVAPQIQGLVYGGTIQISNSIINNVGRMTVNYIIGDTVSLISNGGAITVQRPQSGAVEDAADPRQYVLYYRLDSLHKEIIPPPPGSGDDTPLFQNKAPQPNYGPYP
ncbi:MAG TPA: hypothetical protein VFB38_02455 [Chthonomonadaceae bacterium]|nr:hypothetical protein [Chthonomonadaceae bacterium]